MAHYKGRITELLLETYQNATARLNCPAEAVPKPGQYLQLWSLEDKEKAVPLSAFVTGAPVMQTKAVVIPIDAKLPETWQPGIVLYLRGPLGHGFELPKLAKRVVLAALAGSPGRLLPLAAQALAQSARVVLCGDGFASNALPIEIELRELSALGELIPWADYLAVDVKLEDVGQLRQALGVEEKPPRSLTAEALVVSPMPCGALAQCGVCAVDTGDGQVYLCQEGPVVELNSLI